MEFDFDDADDNNSCYTDIGSDDLEDEHAWFELKTDIPVDECVTAGTVPESDERKPLRGANGIWAAHSVEAGYVLGGYVAVLAILELCYPAVCAATVIKLMHASGWTSSGASSCCGWRYRVQGVHLLHCLAACALVVQAGLPVLCNVL